MTAQEAASSDYFFYHDLVPVQDEAGADILNGLLQPKRSLFYNRGYGADVQSFLGAPNSYIMQAQVAFNCIGFISDRNLRVTDGRSGPDRRAVASQDGVAIRQDGQEMDVTAQYILLSDASSIRSAGLSVGGR